VEPNAGIGVAALEVNYARFGRVWQNYGVPL
jgi:hypothetical protein